LIAVDDQEWTGIPHTGFAVWPGEPIDGLDFELRAATRVFGQVTLGEARQPVADLDIQMYQYGKDGNNLEGVELPNPENSNEWVQPIIVRTTKTDEQGQYEFLVGPGNYDIRGPRQNEVKKFEITDQEELEHNFHAARPEEGRLLGRVVLSGFNTPVPDAQVYGIYRHGLAGRDLETQSDANGEFDVRRELHRTVLHARTEDGTLAGVVEIGPDDQRVTIPIQPLATATARLVDAATGEPLPAREIVYGVRVPIGDDDAPWRTSFGGKANTDGEGRFTLTGLILDQPYEISVTNEDGTGWRTVGNVRAETAEPIDLGDLKLEPPYKPPTHAERVAAAFAKSEPLADRYEAALHDAQLGKLRVLVVFADPELKMTEQFYHLRYENREVFDALNDYWLLPVAATGDRAQEAAALAGQFGVALEGRELPLLVVLSSDGVKLAESDLSAWSGLLADELAAVRDLIEQGLVEYDAFEAATLVNILKQHAAPPLDARQLVADALAQARQENKRVIVQETATWCGPCWRLSRFLDRHRETIGRDYLHIKLDHRWDNWQEVASGLRDEEPRGIPWTAILDAQGNVIATSDGPTGNIGFPSSPEGIEHFLNMLRQSSIRLTEEDLAALKESLEAE
jgi:hypothetical protein